MSLADLLKADLEDDLDEHDEDMYNNSGNNNDQEYKPDIHHQHSSEQIEDVGMQIEEHDPAAQRLLDSLNKNTSNSVKSIAKLLDSEKLTSITSRIEFYQKQAASKATSRTELVGPVEQDPEYKLIVEANNITVEIDSEINVIHKYIRDHYSKRFPELESLVPNSLDYIRTAKELGNEVERAKNNEQLQQFLTTATIMVVSVSASTTQGVKLEGSELALINEACDIVLKLNETKLKIFEYVESRMAFIAPNMSLIVGASTAAKVIGIAGGLTNLSKIPSCNLLLLGQQKKTLSGFSTTQVIPHTGYIYYSDLVQKLPPDLRRIVARIVANKCSLAARIDSAHQVIICFVQCC
jgi:U4/U6 small nuclear ribonucleoprotein PRP31